MTAKDDVSSVFTEVSGIIEQSWGGFDRSFHIHKASAAQPFGRFLSILVKPRLAKSREMRCKVGSHSQRVGTLSKTSEVGSAAALCFQTASLNQGIVQVDEEPVVIKNPVKRSCAHDDVESLLKRKMKEIAGDQTEVFFEAAGEMIARGGKHVLREIDADHSSARQSVEQLGSEAAGSASSIENTFIAL